MSTRRRHALYAVAAITTAMLGGCALVAGLFDPRPPHCSNGIKDGDETGVDCGGACPLCDGAKCAGDNECTSQTCESGTCTRPACVEGSTSKGETCAQCHRCKVDEACASNADCSSGVCSEGKCANCTATSCPGGACAGAVCVAVTCSNGVKDNDEGGVDCGGSCPKACSDGGTGGTGGSSGSTTSSGMGGSGGSGTGGTGTGGMAPTCTDMKQNGNEVDVDCGGSQCAPCIDGKKCNMASDCKSGVCSGDSTPICVAKPPNASCTNDSQCMPGVEQCVNGFCRAQLCSATGCDSVLPACGAANGQLCTSSSECCSGKCMGMQCQPVSCTDGIKNGAETDADCGGLGCNKCISGKTCMLNLDCVGGMCDTTQTPPVCK